MDVFEQAIYEASLRRDRRPLQASQMSIAHICPGAAAISSEADEHHVAHTADDGPLWRPPPGDREVDEEPLLPSVQVGQDCLVGTRLTMPVNGLVVDHDDDTAIFHGRVPYLWSTPTRLLRDGTTWMCAAQQVLCVAGQLAKLGPPVFPGDFHELLAAAVLAHKWTRATGAVELTVYTADAELTVEIPHKEVLDLGFRLRTAVARTEVQRQRRAQGKPLELTPGLHCRGCWHAHVCDAYTAMARACALALPSGAVEVLDLVLANDWLSSAKSRVSALLRRHVDQHGPIDLGDGSCWGRRQVVSNTWSAIDAARTVDLECGRNVSPKIVRVTEAGVAAGIRLAVRQGVIGKATAAELGLKLAARMVELKAQEVRKTNNYGRRPIIEEKLDDSGEPVPPDGGE